MLFLVLALANKPQDKRLFTFVFIVLYLLVALRGHEIGMQDTLYVYLPAFDNMQGETLDWVIETHKHKDLFFYICTHFIQYISTDQQLYLALCALPFFIPNFLLIKKYSSNYAVSVVLFMAVNFYAMSFTGIRHCIALGFVIMAYMKYKRGQNYRMVIYSLVASCFHLSASCFLIVLIIKWYKYKMRYFYVAFIVGILSAVFFIKYLRTLLIGEVLLAFSRFDSYDQSYMAETSLNANWGIIVSILAFICLYYYNKRQVFCLSNNDVNTDCWMMTIGVVCSFLVVIMGEFMRISSFFIIPFLILVPNVLKTKKYYSLLFIMVAYAYFCFRQAVHSEIYDYKFFFE